MHSQTYKNPNPGRPRIRDLSDVNQDMILWYYWFIHFLQSLSSGAAPPSVVGADFGGGKMRRKKRGSRSRNSRKSSRRVRGRVGRKKKRNRTKKRKVRSKTRTNRT